VATDASPAELSRAEVFDLLSGQRRRYVVSYLLDNPGDATLQDTEIVQHGG